MRPKIGVLPLWDEEKDSLWMVPGYLEGVLRAGGLPVVLPLTSDIDLLEQVAGEMDGLLFTGGQDIQPALYERKREAVCGRLCPQRDFLEAELFHRAVLGRRKPAFGICRGLQLFNALMGGTLYQDLPTQWKGKAPVNHRQQKPYDAPAHRVTVLPETPLEAWWTGDLPVNSCHHQGIERLAEGLAPMAVAEDGIVEGIYLPGHPYLVAVQWHPELLLEEKVSCGLFEGFVKACG